MGKSKLVKYKIIGTLNTGVGVYDFAKPFINGKKKFNRIILKKVNIE